jgi:hypothetical protein
MLIGSEPRKNAIRSTTCSAADCVVGLAMTTSNTAAATAAPSRRSNFMFNL